MRSGRIRSCPAENAPPFVGGCAPAPAGYPLGPARDMGSERRADATARWGPRWPWDDRPPERRTAACPSRLHRLLGAVAASPGGPDRRGAGLQGSPALCRRVHSLVGVSDRPGGSEERQRCGVDTMRLTGGRERRPRPEGCPGTPPGARRPARGTAPRRTPSPARNGGSCGSGRTTPTWPSTFPSAA